MSPEYLQICMEFLKSIQNARPMDWSNLITLYNKKAVPHNFTSNGSIQW